MLFQQELKGDVNQHETTSSEYNFGVAPRVHCHHGRPSGSASGCELVFQR